MALWNSGPANASISSLLPAIFVSLQTAAAPVSTPGFARSLIVDDELAVVQRGRPVCGPVRGIAWPRLVPGALAAVDVQDFAGDKRGGFQIHDRVDDVTHLAHLTHRM
jgi:hypothetical protein